jgi:hypothetical protein
MSLETDLRAAILPICSRVYPDVAPAGVARPFVVWQQIGGDLVRPLANDVPDKRNAYIQVAVWSETRIEANTLSLQIEAALINATAFVARQQAALAATFDEDTTLRGARQDFTIWATR